MCFKGIELNIPSYHNSSVITDKMKAKANFCTDAMLLYILLKNTSALFLNRLANDVT